MSQSVELTKFYQAYLKWLDADAPCGAPFSRHIGLCSSLYTFKGIIHKAIKLAEELDNQFTTAGLSDAYPFNNYLSYRSETEEGSIHINPARIAWVREHANG